MIKNDLSIKNKKKLKKIGIIGHFCLNGNRMDGQTVKTREINQYIENYLKEETLKFDTYKIKKNLIKIVLNTHKIVKNSENVIIITSNRGYRVILPIVNFLNKFYKRKVFDFVIGGSRYKIFDKDKFIKRQANKVYKIYVETNKIKQGYNERNINNVEIIPNFKNISPIDKEEIIKDIHKTEIKVCTFARVHIAKGIEDSIEAIRLANSSLNSNVFKLDIYGEIDQEYREQFQIVKKDLPEYVTYQGCVNSDTATNILKNYDILLFLTYWRGEGFPRNYH